MEHTFPALPSDRPQRLNVGNEGGENIWDICKKLNIAGWAFMTIRKWAKEDHQQLFEFYADFRKLQKLHWDVCSLLIPDKEEKRIVNFEPVRRQGKTEREHLLLLAMCGGGWHHLVGDLLFYTIDGGEDIPCVTPLSPALLGILPAEE